MVRLSTPPSARLEALLDERDHIRIQLSLERDKQPQPKDTISQLQKRFKEVEELIQAVERSERQHRH